MAKRIVPVLLCTLIVAAVFVAVGFWNNWFGPAPGPLVAVPAESEPFTLRPEAPDDVAGEVDGSEDQEKNREIFAEFAWKNFVALNWPALPGVRGVADADKTFDSPAENVTWGTWKSAVELFPADAETHPPSDWETYDPVVLSGKAGEDGVPQQIKIDRGAEANRRKLLVRHTKLADLNESGFKGVEEFNRPLIAQNRTFVRYEIHFNRVHYDWVLSKRYYLRKNLPPDSGFDARVPADGAMQFPDQSIIVKAAWREVNDCEKDFFYHVQADLVDRKPGDSPHVLRSKTMGLVGMHIIHKTPNHQKWVWSTFEHVSNTERAPWVDLPPSFNSYDKGMDFDKWGVNHQPPALDPEKPVPGPDDPVVKPVEVARPTITLPGGKTSRYHPVYEKVNERYWLHPQIAKTVWRNYRLVAVQWPIVPKKGDAVDPRGFFPPTPPVANATIETYLQKVNCFGCHAGGAPYHGMVFYLHKRAIPVKPDALTVAIVNKLNEISKAPAKK